MRWTTSSAIVLALELLAPASWAEPLHSYSVSDGNGIRSILIEAPDRQGSVCMISPEQAGSCDVMPPEALASARQFAEALTMSRMIGAGILQLANCRLVVAVSSMPYKAADLSEESIGEFLQGMNNAAAESPALRTIEPAHRVRVSRWEGLRLVVEQQSGDATLHTTNYGLFGHGTYYSIVFVSLCGDSPPALAAQQHILDTLDYEPGDLGLFGKPRAEIQGYRAAKVLFGLAPVVFVAGVIAVGVWKARKRRRSAASPRP